MRKTEQFEKLMSKFRFTRPVPPEVRRRISSSKKKQFRTILKKTGGYSISFGIIASLFFSLKKLGMGVSIVKTAIILASVTAAATVLIVAGVYTTVKRIDKDEKREVGVLETDKQVAQPVEQKDAEPVDSSESVAGRIGVRVFAADNADKNMSITVTDAIADELALLRGEEFTLNIRKSNDEKRYRMMLVGSVEQRDGVFMITARVSDVRDSRVLFYASEEAASPGDITAACRSIARKIAQSIPAGNPVPGK
jgi:hypothetical protein